MLLVTGLHLETKPLTSTLSAAIQPIPYAPSGPAIEFMSLQRQGSQAGQCQRRDDVILPQIILTDIY